MVLLFISDREGEFENFYYIFKQNLLKVLSIDFQRRI